LSNHKRLYTPVRGKTYSLFARGDDSKRYFAEIEHLADMFLQRCPDERKLLGLIQKVAKNPFLEGLRATGADRKTIQFVRETLRQSLMFRTTYKACLWRRGLTARFLRRKRNTTCT
jgi:hypothetical protein